ncbi:MAG: aminopeptidase P N-terminal domain-containing protein [Puniceicoccales bacterium]|jgi:Xaa-Pro aminopeptidase|nr:aminopeptidase P N-terminal domain-containing protein [Puniceicoccales bacterium]
MLSAAFFTGNRNRLSSRLAPGSLAVVNSNDVPATNGDGTAAFYQNTDLYYLTGVRQEESILLLCPDATDSALREILFLRETTPQLEIWEGKKLTRDAATRLSGIATVKSLGEFPAVFRQLACESENIYLNTNEHKRATVVTETRDARFVAETRNAYPLHNYKRLAPHMHALRVVKSKEEIATLQSACDLTAKAFQRVLRFTRPGVNEAEIEAEFAHEFIRARERFAYLPIVATGKNAIGLHYTENNTPCRSGELLLLDVGATRHLYNADMTRTIPVNGRFTRRQRKIYQSVQFALRELSAQLKPGLLWKDWQKNACALLQDELGKLDLLTPRDIRKQDPSRPACFKYFMHGIGHPLGLDVHDVGYTTQPMQAGWVMTCEPGLYIAEEGIGIRLENNLVVTDTAPVNLMQKIPLDPDEIEALMNAA